MLADTKRQGGREAYWPLIPELISAPQEIWVGFARSTISGRVALRRRYVRLFQIDKRRALGIVADADADLWSGMTFFRGNISSAKGLRRPDLQIVSMVPRTGHLARQPTIGVQPGRRLQNLQWEL